MVGVDLPHGLKAVVAEAARVPPLTPQQQVVFTVRAVISGCGGRPRGDVECTVTMATPEVGLGLEVW